jgi:adenylate cyclase
MRNLGGIKWRVILYGLNPVRWVRAIRPVHLIALAILCAFIALRVVDPSPLQTLRLKVFDLYQQIEPRDSETKQPVRIVDLDEASLAAYGQWPWPRTLVAQLLDQLVLYQTGPIGFDIVFAEPDRTSPGLIAGTLPGLDEATRDALEQLPSNEEVLAAAIVRSGRSVLGQSTTSAPEPVATDRISVKANFATKVRRGSQFTDATKTVLNFAGLVRNRPELEKAAQGIGLFTIKPEQDGIIRRVPMVVAVGDTLYPSLSVEMLRVATGNPTIAVELDHAGMVGIIVDKRFPIIPTDSIGRTWVHYTPHDPARFVSAKDVLEGNVQREKLAGHFILIGTSAIGLQDIRATPLNDAVPGVEVHAQLLETVLSQSFLSRPNFVTGAELFALVVVGLLLIILVPILGPIWTLILGGSLIAGLTGLSWWLYIDAGLMFDMIYGAIASGVLYAAMTYMNYMSEEAQKRQVRGAFSHYMSPALVEQLAKDPSKLRLGGEMREMTLLFTDIRGFTPISELFDAEGLTSFINGFLTPMTEIILERRGTIDKYMGDCIMAFWNAPLDDETHVANACRSALEMNGRLVLLNDELEADAKSEGRRFIPIRIGTGLNTGECCVGNMGSDMRFDYSVLGDTVNLASRLEGQSKTYGAEIVLGETTHAQAGEFATLELDLIQVKGKTVPVRVYSLLGDEAVKTSPEFQELFELHGDMIASYRTQDWAGCRKKIEECRELNFLDKLEVLYDLYNSRVNTYEKSPPGDDWDGVYIATTK